jgi:hypothetical protein
MQSLMELVNMPDEENVVKEAINDPKDVIRLSLVYIIICYFILYFYNILL